MPLEKEREDLEYAIAEITEIAQGFGLDFYPMRYVSRRWISLPTFL